MTGTKLLRFLESTGITDTDLARESGVSIRHVSYIKNGQREPTRQRMAAILGACRRITENRDIAITDLFDFSEPKRKRAA